MSVSISSTHLTIKMTQIKTLKESIKILNTLNLYIHYILSKSSSCPCLYFIVHLNHCHAISISCSFICAQNAFILAYVFLSFPESIDWLDMGCLV